MISAFPVEINVNIQETTLQFLNGAGLNIENIFKENNTFEKNVAVIGSISATEYLNLPTALGGDDVAASTKVRASSANWDNSYTIVAANSAIAWNYQGTDLKALSANWQNNYNSYSQLSSNFARKDQSNTFNGFLSSNNYLAGKFIGLSDADEATITPRGFYADSFQGYIDFEEQTIYLGNVEKTSQWNQVDPIATNQVRSLSANWQNSYTTVATNSANWNSVRSNVNTLSSRWESSFTTVAANSATTWNYQGTDLKALSANWQNSYTTVAANSATWGSSVSTNLSVQTLSTTSNFTLSASNSNSILRFTTASNILFLVPHSSTLNLPIGAWNSVRQVGAGQITLSGLGGVVLNAELGLKTAAQHADVFIVKVAQDVWDTTGGIA